MIGLRPKTTALYLERPRLLRRLPDSSGFVVWLEAAYGYGKSVLTSQWALQLEAAGWRVVWLSLMGEDARGLLARVLELPSDTPWSLVLEALWQEKTLVILEDLEGTEKLSLLLKNIQGIVLISSRKRLPEPEIPRLKSEGRLVHLTARELAFTLPEARMLFDGDERAQLAWERSQGWSLPLHLAALTGTELEISNDDVDHEALLEGMRESLEQGVWDEALLLSTLNYLPLEQATALTRQLADLGFAQALETGYRLHPMAAETILERYKDEICCVLEREASRLTPLMHGEALERVEMLEALGSLIESDVELAEIAPDAVLRWDALAPLPRGVNRKATVGDALGLLRREREGVELILEAAQNLANTPRQTVDAYRKAVWWLTDLDTTKAREVIAIVQPLLEQVDAVTASRFLNNASRVHFETGEYEAGEAMVRRALEMLEIGHPRRTGLMMNLGLLRWYQYGDLEARLGLFSEALAGPANIFVAATVGHAHYDLGRQYLLLDNLTKAREHFQKTLEHSRQRPWVGLAAQGFLYLLDGNLEPLTGLLARVEQWERFEQENQLRGFWALSLVASEHHLQAIQLVQAASQTALTEGGSRVVPLTAKALALWKLGRTPEALEVLALDYGSGREADLYWRAAQYRITRNNTHLEVMLGQTMVGARILPGLLPLSELPRNQAELADVYSLEAVLKSGWKDAIKRRLLELPALEVRVLGGFGITRLNDTVTLTQRPKEIFLLLLLNESREAIAQMLWSELEPEAIRNNLNYNLNALRKSIEPWGIPSYLLDTGLVRVHSDLQDLEGALKARDAALVCDLYKGDFAPGVDVPAINESRDALRQRVINLLERAALDTTPSQAETFLARTLEIDPFHESALEALLHLLMTQGRRVQAERLYKDFKHRLWVTLNLEPSSRTRAVLGAFEPESL